MFIGRLLGKIKITEQADQSRQNSGESNADIQLLSTIQTNPFLPSTAALESRTLRKLNHKSERVKVDDEVVWSLNESIVDAQLRSLYSAPTLAVPSGQSFRACVSCIGRTARGKFQLLSEIASFQ